ncbi:MAG TPA: extracellular solute-binding protein, partial [Actinomycetes bacterium]|nr:extracellular solute-binding protein [Actinomycetes bacterium]
MRARTRARLLPLALAVALLAAAGCGSDEPSGSSGGAAPQGFTPPEVPMLQSLGAGEGKVNLVAWAGYVEDGSTDPKVDWVTSFEKETGCQVNVKVAATSDEMVQLMKSGQYDAVSASGDASLRLVAGGDVAPVNTDLVPNYKDVFDALKMKPWNSVNGKAYGIPHGRGANLLMWRTDVVKTAPDSWGVVFDTASPYKGKVTAYDSPIYIADAALYLKATKPELGITNVYELDDKQFQASV